MNEITDQADEPSLETLAREWASQYPDGEHMLKTLLKTPGLRERLGILGQCTDEGIPFDPFEAMNWQKFIDVTLLSAGVRREHYLLIQRGNDNPANTEGAEKESTLVGLYPVKPVRRDDELFKAYHERVAQKRPLLIHQGALLDAEGNLVQAMATTYTTMDSPQEISAALLTQGEMSTRIKSLVFSDDKVEDMNNPNWHDLVQVLSEGE